MKGVTTYQLEILQTVSAGYAKSGLLVDFDQLLEALSWAPTKASAQFTIRALIEKGFLEKCGLQSRRGRNRVCYQLTRNGEVILDPRKAEVVDASVVADFTGAGAEEKSFSEEEFILPGVVEEDFFLEEIIEN